MWNSDIEKNEAYELSDRETRCIMIRECFKTGEISKAMELARKAGCYTTLVDRLVMSEDV